VEYRRKWDRLVHLVGSTMAYAPAEIDTAIPRP
jgi:hypothetical protein